METPVTTPQLNQAKRARRGGVRLSGGPAACSGRFAPAWAQAILTNATLICETHDTFAAPVVARKTPPTRAILSPRRSPWRCRRADGDRVRCVPKDCGQSAYAKRLLSAAPSDA